MEPKSGDVQAKLTIQTSNEARQVIARAMGGGGEHSRVTSHVKLTWSDLKKTKREQKGRKGMDITRKDKNKQSSEKLEDEDETREGEIQDEARKKQRNVPLWCGLAPSGGQQTAEFHEFTSFDLNCP